MFADHAEIKVTPMRRLHGDGFLVDESLWEGTAIRAGRQRTAPLVRLLHVIEFTPGGQIQHDQVWFDFAAIVQQLPQQK